MKFKFFVYLTFLVSLIGCIPNVSPKEMQPSPVPTNKLQITYIRNAVDQNFGEFYAIDVTCATKDKICLGKPELLFRTLKMPNGEQSKPKGLLTDYSWSPDGNKIAIISAGDILIGDIATQKWLNITNSPDIDEHQPKWSSDGNFLYYILCSRDYSGMCLPQFFRSNLTSNEKVPMLQSISKLIASYDISPDNQKIVFSITEKQGYYQLYQGNLDGSNIHKITSGKVNNSVPSISADGNNFVFVRFSNLDYPNSKRQSDIILRTLISGEEKNFTEKFDGEAFSPAFSPTGNWIVFDSFDSDLNVNIFLVSIEKGNILQVTNDNKEVNPAWRLLKD